MTCKLKDTNLNNEQTKAVNIRDSDVFLNAGP